MGLLKILLIVGVAGLIGSMFRLIGVRATARPARRKGAPMRTARGVGVPEGEGLLVWLPSGSPLPATCKRVIRVSASAGPTVPLSFHTDGTEMEPLFDAVLGPIDRSKMNVRLVQVTLQISEAGRLKVTARVQKTRAVIPVKVRSKPRPVPTELDPSR